jgi:glycosyltransferase involved in cell wall biosynthesis
MRTITLALTHYNRFDFLLEAVGQVLSDPRISEIVISDDCSTDGSYEQMVSHFKSESRVRIHQNLYNQDCYKNKRIAVEIAAGGWVILFDSDNILSPAYLDELFRIDLWDPKIAYCPTFAEPHFDYRALGGLRVDAGSVAQYLKRTSFLTALNTANYFFNRDEYLRVWDGSLNPHTADSLFQNYNWLKGGNALYFVPGLCYGHRVHDKSHYKLNVHKTGKLAQNIEHKLSLLK